MKTGSKLIIFYQVGFRLDHVS